MDQDITFWTGKGGLTDFKSIDSITDDCIKGYSTFSGPEFRQRLARMKELGLSMQGKGGMQIYVTSREIIKILGELEERC